MLAQCLFYIFNYIIHVKKCEYYLLLNLKHIVESVKKVSTSPFTSMICIQNYKNVRYYMEHFAVIFMQAAKMRGARRLVPPGRKIMAKALLSCPEMHLHFWQITV